MSGSKVWVESVRRWLDERETAIVKEHGPQVFATEREACAYVERYARRFVLSRRFIFDMGDREAYLTPKGNLKPWVNVLELAESYSAGEYVDLFDYSIRECRIGGNSRESDSESSGSDTRFSGSDSDDDGYGCTDMYSEEY